MKTDAMTIEGRFEDTIALSAQEASLLAAVRELFLSKGTTWHADNFRVAFVKAAMHGYCDACGRSGYSPCYCTRDD